MIKLSQTAYQNAIRLLPNDQDWHYGYAELLCDLAIWNTDDPARLTASDPLLIGWFQQLKATLDLRPKDAKALSLLKALALPDRGYNNNKSNWVNVGTPGLVDISGAQPDYLILTPQPSPTLETSQTPTSETAITPSTIPSLPSPTPFPTPTQTIPPTKTAPPLVLRPNFTAALSTTPSAAMSNDFYRILELAGIDIVFLFGLLGFFWLRRNHMNFLTLITRRRYGMPLELGILGQYRRIHFYYLLPVDRDFGFLVTFMTLARFAAFFFRRVIARRRLVRIPLDFGFALFSLQPIEFIAQAMDLGLVVPQVGCLFLNQVQKPFHPLAGFIPGSG